MNVKDCPVCGTVNPADAEWCRVCETHIAFEPVRPDESPDRQPPVEEVEEDDERGGDVDSGPPDVDDEGRDHARDGPVEDEERRRHRDDGGPERERREEREERHEEPPQRQITCPNPACQRPNDPERTLCWHCGTRLRASGEEEGEPEPGPWRRLVASLRARGRRREPRRRRSLAPLGVVGLLAVLAAVGIVWGGALVSAGGEAFDAIRRRFFGEWVSVTAAAASADVEAPGHGADNLIDNFRNTSWVAGDEGSGVGARLRVTFADEEEIDVVMILATGTVDGARHPRPRRLRVHLPGGRTQELTLEDTPDFQHFRLGTDGPVRRLQFEVVEVHGASAPVAITEVEFFRRE